MPNPQSLMLLTTNKEIFSCFLITQGSFLLRKEPCVLLFRLEHKMFLL